MSQHEQPNMLFYFVEPQLLSTEVYPALRVTSLLQLKVTLQNFDLYYEVIFIFYDHHKQNRNHG